MVSIRWYLGIKKFSAGVLVYMNIYIYIYLLRVVYMYTNIYIPIYLYVYTYIFSHLHVYEARQDPKPKAAPAPAKAAPRSLQRGQQHARGAEAASNVTESAILAVLKGDVDRALL